MRVGIIGIGMVGSACKYGFEKLGHKVMTFDIKDDSKIEDVLPTDICYICVPTNPLPDGSCDVSIVESTVDKLISLRYNGIIVVKSTVEPGTTQKLIQKYNDGWPSSNLKHKICFVPEFLRERCAITDFTENHDLLAVGTEDSFIYKMILKCHGKYPLATAMLNPTEAELLKYYSNVFNAVRVIFANEMYEVCRALKVDYTKIKESFMLRKTATDMYMDVNENFRGYGGYCLPKDTKALASLVEKLGLDLKLFECIDEENHKFKTTVFEGMRLGV